MVRVAPARAGVVEVAKALLAHLAQRQPLGSLHLASVVAISTSISAAAAAASAAAAAAALARTRPVTLVALVLDDGDGDDGEDGLSREVDRDHDARYSRARMHLRDHVDALLIYVRRVVPSIMLGEPAR